MNQGWISVHRKIADNKFWLSEKFTKGQAWIDILLLANHKENTVDVRGNLIKIPRGYLGWSEDRLAKRWNWSRGKVRRYFSVLQTEQQIVQHKSSVLSLVEVINYDLYQTSGTTDSTTNDTTDGHQTVQQTDTNNKDNNKNNDNNSKKKFIKPTIGEVNSYISEKKYSIDAETFWNHYESVGWKVGRNPMKSWQSCLVTWQKRNKTESTILSTFPTNRNNLN